MRNLDTDRASSARGFTLVELLLSMGVLAILILLIVQVTSQTSDVWRRTTAKADQFREARDAFEAITRNLSQATLNTYYDYFNAAGERRTSMNARSFVPARYGRHSELRFQTGRASDLVGGPAANRPTHGIFFQAPLGFTVDEANASFSKLLNTWGYYIEFRPDTDRPSFMTGATQRRYRLMEFMEPAEDLNVYQNPDGWLDAVAGGTKSHVIASNIIALVILPKLPSVGPAGDPTVDPDGDNLAPSYEYDSTSEGQASAGPEYNSLHQLPPVVEVTMVAIDASSAANLEMENGTSPPNFGLGSMFQSADPEDKKEDLAALVGNLAARRINYRVFSTEVSLRGAKWSREQVAQPTP